MQKRLYLTAQGAAAVERFLRLQCVDRSFEDPAKLEGEGIHSMLRDVSPLYRGYRNWAAEFELVVRRDDFERARSILGEPPLRPEEGAPEDEAPGDGAAPDTPPDRDSPPEDLFSPDADVESWLPGLGRAANTPTRRGGSNKPKRVPMPDM